MATIGTAALLNQYQKLFSKKLLGYQKQLIVLAKYADKFPFPKEAGAKTISMFRRSPSKVNSATGQVDAVQALIEGAPIATFANNYLERIDVPLQQYGEATKITDIANMTDLFDSLEQNIQGMGEDAALQADTIIQRALVTATDTGVTFNQPDGTTNTQRIEHMYAQSAANFAALGSTTPSGGKITATDFIRASTRLKINRAQTINNKYVAIVPPAVTFDLQNDPDWIDASNFADPNARLTGVVGSYAGCLMVETTNAFSEDATGSEGTFAVPGSTANLIVRSFVCGKGAYGISEMAGQSQFKPKIIIVNEADKTDPLNQYMTAGWKSFWAASALNTWAAVCISSRTEFA